MAAAARRHCLLLALLLPVVVAMPEPVSEETWRPPGGAPPLPLSMPPTNGPGRPFFHSGDNRSEPLAGSLEAYCQTLLQVPVPSEQVPWFCLCTHCHNQQGPKGEAGDRGLPGTRPHPVPTVSGHRDQPQRYLSPLRSPWESWKTRPDGLQGSSGVCGQTRGHRWDMVW